MTDTVDTKVLVSTGTHYVIRITNESDGTGESGVAKIDKSTLTDRFGSEPKAVDIMLIEGNIGGFNYIVGRWDHSTDDEAFVLPPGSVYRDYRPYGGNRDPITAGGTGDLLLTTDGAVDGASYDLTIHCELRSSDA